jgi:hypothetical protein
VFLSQIIERLNDLFAGDGLTDDDVVIYGWKADLATKGGEQSFAVIANV